MPRPSTLALGRACMAALCLTGCIGAFDELPAGPIGGSASRKPTDSAQDPSTGEVTPQDPAFVPVAPLLRRLTRDEYLFTVEDQLGVQLGTDDQALIPGDRPLDGFANTASGQVALPNHVLAYNTLSERVLAGLDFEVFLSAHASCRDVTKQECIDGFVASAASLLFRRPTDASERHTYGALFATLVGDGADFAQAARGTIQALLQAPQFLYLIEQEVDDSFHGLRAVRGYEMASRLSYYLWQSAPDRALLEAAKSGAIDDVEGVSKQVARMLDDPRAKRSTARFVLDWARLESLPDDDGLRAELVETAIAFYQSYIWEERGGLAQIFTTPKAFLTPALAAGYGVMSLGDGVREYDLTGVAGRVGLLAQPGIIAGMTNADGGEIVARGLFQMTQLFCGDAPNPPASLQDQIDGFLATLPKNASQREVAEARLTRPECGACHARFDPVGYALEHFDSRGRYRDKDAFGNALSDDGWIPQSLSGAAEVKFTNFEAFAKAISESDRVQRCLMQKNVQFALGQRLEANHAGSIEQLNRTTRDLPYEEIVQALVRHDLFRTLPIE